MILVQSPLKRDYIKDLLDGKEFDGIQFTFNRQDQMKLFFEHTGDAKDAAAAAKKVIKKSEFGAALYFTVSYE